MSGIKTEKSKKFQPININNSYQPIINKSNKSSTIRHVGLQPLGKIGVNRRVPAQSLQQKEPLTQLEENGLAPITDSNSSSATNNDDQQQQQQQQQQSTKQSPPLTPSQTQTPNSPKDDNNQEKCNREQQQQCPRDQPQLSALDTPLPSAHLSQQDVPQRLASPLAAHPGAQASVHSIYSHPLPVTQSNVSHNSHRNTPPRLAAAAKPILTDKELENLDDITRQTKWASGKITIDYDAKLNFSDDEEDQPQQQQQQQQQSLHPSQESSQVAHERRLQREGNLNDYEHNNRRRDHRDRRDRARSPPPPRHRNHLPPLDSRPPRNSPPSHQLPERAKQADRGRPQPDHLQQNQQSLSSHSAGSQQQQQQQHQQTKQQPLPAPQAPVLEAEVREKSQEGQDHRPQPVLNGGAGGDSGGSSLSEGKGVANKKTMSAPQVAPPRREGSHPSRHGNNYNSHHRNFHQNHYQQNHGNNMGHPQHNNHGQHQSQQRHHHQHQQRPTPMARLNQAEMHQPLNHLPIQHDKHPSGSPGMVMNVMSHSKAHHRLGAPSPAEQLAQSTAKLQINLGNSANPPPPPPSGNNNPNNHHHSHHNPIIDNGLNSNNNINSSNHHNSHRAPTAPRFMREHHNHRNNSPSFTGDQQRHNQQPMRNQQAHQSPQRAGRQQAQQAKPRQSSPSQRQSPPALATAPEATQASGPAPPKDQSPPQQHPNPKPAKPTSEPPQSRQTPPPSAPNLNQQHQAIKSQQQQHHQQPQEQPHQSQQLKQQPSQPARQAQSSRERDPPRQQELDSQSNKYRPVISRVFYRSDIKRVSGSRQGDYK